MLDGGEAEMDTEAPVTTETEYSSSPMMDSAPTESTAAPPPPPEDEVDPFCEEDNGLFEIMKLLNFTVQPRQSKSNPDEATFEGDKNARIGERECSGCTGEKHVDDLFNKLEADVVSEKEKEIEQLTYELKNEREAGVDSEKKITQLVEFISFIHGEFGKLFRSFVSLTTKNLDVCNVLNFGPFQDEAETDEFLEGLNSLAKQLLDEFENLGDTKNLLERMNEILKVNVDASINLQVPEDIEETCSQEYEDVNDYDADADVRVRSRSSVSTVVVDPENSDAIEDHPLNAPSTGSMAKVRIPKRKKVIKTETNLECANKQHGVDISRRHWGNFCLCGCKYSSKSTLSVHIKYMTSEWQFECDICKKRFLFASYLRFHQDKAHGIVDLAHGAFTCSQCGKAFDSRKQHLHHHRSVHRNTGFQGPSGQNNRGGIRCGRNTGRGARGGRGANTGTRSRKVQQSAGSLHGVDRESAAIQCICGNTYSHKSALSLHISTKLYGKIFKCRDCGKRYDVHQELKRHVLSVHKKNYLEGKFGCSICGKPFDSMMDLKRHRHHTHGIECRAGKRKKILNKERNPQEDNSIYVDGDLSLPIVLAGESNGDEDVEGNQSKSNSDAIDIDYETYGDEMLPPTLERQELSSPPIEFQVDEDSGNEVVCIE